MAHNIAQNEGQRDCPAQPGSYGWKRGLFRERRDEPLDERGFAHSRIGQEYKAAIFAGKQWQQRFSGIFTAEQCVIELLWRYATSRAGRLDEKVTDGDAHILFALRFG